MVRVADFIVMDCNVLLGAKLVHQLLDRARSYHFVARALDDDARRWAGGKEGEIIHVRGRRDRDEALDFGAAHKELHPDQRAEAVARDPRRLGFGMDRLDPVERGRSIGKLTNAVVERSLRLANATEIEAQRRETAAYEGLIE